MTDPSISPEAPLAMTLAGMAYAFPEDIGRFLANGAATRDWAPTWVPEERKGYFAYVATSPSAGGWAVAVRGTNPSATLAFLQNIRSDIDVWPSEAWDAASGPDGRIARGAKEGLSVLSSLTDDRGETLLDHLVRTVPAGATVVVTGHSLGGCLASVLALSLHRASNGRFNVRPITFAAPTAGDQRFAELYQATFPNAERYFNRTDLVPRAWHDLGKFKDLYDDPGPKCPPPFALAATGAAGILSRHGYTQPGAGIALPLQGGGPARSARGGLAGMMDRLIRHLFFLEALHQHMPDTYLANLGADPLPFKLPLPWLFRNARRRLSRLIRRK